MDECTTESGAAAAAVVVVGVVGQSRMRMSEVRRTLIHTGRCCLHGTLDNRLAGQLWTGKYGSPENAGLEND